VSTFAGALHAPAGVAVLPAPSHQALQLAELGEVLIELLSIGRAQPGESAA
jgi:hypothetical protein